jgi:hypothetical protein
MSMQIKVGDHFFKKSEKSLRSMLVILSMMFLESYFWMS